MDKHLIIFIKNPELGKAKTRIANTTGDVKALDIYKELLEHTRKATSSADCKRHLFYSSFIDREDSWSSDIFFKQVQIDGGLGEKMQDAFQKVSDTPAKLVIIGSDCGELTADIITQAFDALSTHDVVLGPTFDGGYYLLGIRDPSIDLFSDIAWSTEVVYEQTVEKIKADHLTYFELPRLHDIDYEEDYLAWKASITK